MCILFHTQTPQCKTQIDVNGEKAGVDSILVTTRLATTILKTTMFEAFKLVKTMLVKKPSLAEVQNMTQYDREPGSLSSTLSFLS